MPTPLSRTASYDLTVFTGQGQIDAAALFVYFPELVQEVDQYLNDAVLINLHTRSGSRRQ